ncbi:MAG: mycothiol conjugate amidase Mca, partial [Longispora sp.]|nr:mycothiol conjugate amidase Mca [Longispora sp. (in: high G+C Gram-positive bacteria)]
MAEALRMMAVHAHPDDESSKGAATMVRYVREGVDVLVVTCTGGERGSVLNPRLDSPEIWADITEIRRKEMDAAREILGVRQGWLGFVDSGLPDGYLQAAEADRPELPEGCFGRQDPEVAAECLVKAIREFRPHVVTTYDEDGGYPHPDHVMTHRIAVLAFAAAGDPALYPDAGKPWTPAKLYYHIGFHRDQLTALHETVLAEGMESPYGEWLNGRDWMKDKGDRVTTRVESG